MKLPEELKQLYSGVLYSSEALSNSLTEAVVRDCAKVRIKLGGGGEELLPAVWRDAILARYGLEPK